MFETLPTVLLVICLSPVLAEPPTPNKTYTILDPKTNRSLECDACPPGTHLVSWCTATRVTRCSPCPAGSFTELWNGIQECLRCQTCEWNQEMKAECRADRDRQCQCAAGHYLEENIGTCFKLSKCPTGEGVLHRGTPVADTECHACPVGTFSDQDSAEQECVKHRRCEATAGHQLLLPGTSWHDSLCLKCDDDRAAMEHLRGILPVFFTHHRIPHRRLRHVYNKMQISNGQTQRSSLNLQAKINSWLSSATSAQLEELPAILREAGAEHTADRLKKKLQHLQQNSKRVCGHVDQVDVQ